MLHYELLLLVSVESSAFQAVREVDPVVSTSLQDIIDQERNRLRLKGLSAAAYIPGRGIWEGVSGISGPTAAQPLAQAYRWSSASAVLNAVTK